MRVWRAAALSRRLHGAACARAAVETASDAAGGGRDACVVERFAPRAESAVTFELSPAAARAKFEAWCRCTRAAALRRRRPLRRCRTDAPVPARVPCTRALLHRSQRWLAPGDLWNEADPHFSVTAAHLPYWAFDADADVRYRGARTGRNPFCGCPPPGAAACDNQRRLYRVRARGAGMVGFKGGGGKGTTRWVAVQEWREQNAQALRRSDALMQVYAAFDLRRDHVAAAVSGQHAVRAVPWSGGATGASGRVGAVVPPYELGRGLAWTLARRRIEGALRARAADALRAAAGADEVRDLECVIRFTHLHSTAVRLPAYVLRYAHGTTLSDDQSKAIVPERCVGAPRAPRQRG
jgi:hypothetical protein